MDTYQLTNASILANTDAIQEYAKSVTNLRVQAGVIMDGARAGIKWLALGGNLVTNRFVTNGVPYVAP